MITYRRRQTGNYIANAYGTRASRLDVRLTIVNVAGPGPREPRWQGVSRVWHVREGGTGEYDVGSKTVHEAETFSEAKAWAEQRYGGAA